MLAAAWEREVKQIRERLEAMAEDGEPTELMEAEGYARLQEILSQLEALISK